MLEVHFDIYWDNAFFFYADVRVQKYIKEQLYAQMLELDD